MYLLGKSLNEYVNVITLPLAVWIVWSIVSFIINLAFAPAVKNAGVGGMGADVTALMIVGVVALIGLVVNVLAGIWIGWRTVTIIHGSYGHAAVAGVIAAAVNSAVTFILVIISGVFTGDLLAAVVSAIIGAVFGFIVGAIIAIILAAIGVFIASVMGKR